MAATTIVVKHAIVMPSDPGPGSFIQDGAVVIADGKIIAVGNSHDVLKDHPQNDIVIDGSRSIVMPGLVSAHTHITGDFLRGLTEDIEDHFYGFALPLEDYLTDEIAYRINVLGAIECAKYGITCINDIYHYSDAMARGISEAGLRGVIAHKVFDVNLRNIGHDDYSRDEEQGRQKLKTNLKLIEDWHGKSDGRITCRIGTHATDTCSPELLKTAKEEAVKRRVGIHIHVAQSEREAAYVHRAYGKTSVGFLDGLGFFDKSVLAAHLILANEEDLETIRRRGAAIGHCPVIYGKVGAYPNLELMLSKGIPVGLGVDWLSMDIWENMRQLIAINRILSHGKRGINASTAFHLATMGSAKALGMDGSIGSITPGKKADVTIIDRHRAHLAPLRNPLQNTVYYANGGDVRTVIIDGRIVVEDGVVKTVDEDRAIDMAQQAAEQVWSHIG
jgi:5-methylthioadenosine/S-adenosylhomocysteine deaminase